MATRLNQVLTFTAVPGGGQATVTHALNIQGLAVLPDLLLPDNDNFSFVSATTTSVTVMNNGSDVATLHLWCLRQHTIDRAYGAAATTNLSPQPFWVGSASSSSSARSNLTTTLTNDSGVLAVTGAPVYSSDDDAFDLAQADALSTSALTLGLVGQAPGIVNGDAGPIVTQGDHTATMAQWDAVTGQTGGLSFNTLYYVDPTTRGKLTITAPVTAGQVVKPIGYAVSATKMIVNPWPSVLLS